jgi:hypothetical protein
LQVQRVSGERDLAHEHVARLQSELAFVLQFFSK